MARKTDPESIVREIKRKTRLAWHITDREGWFGSESSVYRILKTYDLVTSPNYIVFPAASVFRHKTRRVHELWQTDFTYMKVIRWGWYYLSTILDDYSRNILELFFQNPFFFNQIDEYGRLLPPNPPGKCGEKDLWMDGFNHLASISEVS
jgi:hypothetical protein